MAAIGGTEEHKVLNHWGKGGTCANFQKNPHLSNLVHPAGGFFLPVGRIQDPNFSSCIFEIFFRLDPTDFEKRLQKQSPIKDMSDPLSPTLLDCPSAEVSDEAMAM